MRDVKLGRVAGLPLRTAPSALGSVAAFVALAGGVTARRGRTPLWRALAVGVLMAFVHWGSALLHQLGHAAAARRTGYPMVGIRLWGLLGTSLYPPDEPWLPARLHRQRAAGGPLGSALAALVLLPPTLLVYRPGLARTVLRFALLDNLLVFVLGSLLPLGFTDGTTLLAWPRR